MNDKNFSSALLLAILLTLIAVLAQDFFPQKRFVVWPNTQINSYFYSTALADGTPAAFWLDHKDGVWRCAFPEAKSEEYFACSYNALFEKTPGKGIDLSRYTHLNLKLNYTGSAHRMRLYIRNFDPAFSTTTDTNSTKFNSVSLHTRDLVDEVQVDLNEFIVADWWLSSYDIPRKLSQPDIRNALTLGIDYIEGMTPGNHDMKIEKIEFVGEWISAEHWYLFILGSWMLGIFSFALIKLTHLNKQSKHDIQVINQLNDENILLSLETDKFRRLSTIDPLTQAYNRFGIDQIVSTLLIFNREKHINNSAPDFALIIVDVDHFKRINDRRGHDTGDRILQAISTLISGNIRKQDFLGRWGGEEFVIIMPNTHKEFAMALAEKIRMTIYDTIFEPENPLSISASFGISEKHIDEDFASTFKRADKALYTAKAQGRNCCVMAEEELLP